MEAVAVLMDWVAPDIVRDTKCNIMQRRKGFRAAATCRYLGAILVFVCVKFFVIIWTDTVATETFQKLVYRTMVKQYASLRT